MTGFIGFQEFYRNNNKISAKANTFLNEELFLFPLYKKINIKGLGLTDIFPIADTKLELYCHKCKKRRIFDFLLTGDGYYFKENVPISGGAFNQNTLKKFGGIFEENKYFYFIAKSYCGHNLIIFFEIIDENNIMKIGQSPSIYDINENINNKAFLKELGEEYAYYYKTACSLNSFNSNIGAMTYLRRIFEKLLIDCFTENQDALSIEMQSFMKLRMDEKIQELKPFLPNLMFDNGFNGIYSKISDGIHNLTEEECQKIFSPLRMAIEEVLIEKMEEKDKKTRRLELGKNLQNL